MPYVNLGYIATVKSGKMPTVECKECTAKLFQLDEMITCSGGCGYNFCLKCSNIKKNEIKIITENINLKWFCNQCTLSDTNTKFIEIKHLISKCEQSKLKAADVKQVLEQLINNKCTQIKTSIVSDFNTFLEHNIGVRINAMKNEIIKEISSELQKCNDLVKTFSQ